MVDTVISLGAPEIGQFYYEGQWSLSHSACGLTALLMAASIYGAMKGVTLNDLIRETPLIDGWDGLPCEWIATIGVKYGLDCRLERMDTDKLKAHIKAKHAPICLIKYSDIPRQLVQDKNFKGYHFELCDGFNDTCFLMNDPDRTLITSSWGQNIPVPFATIDKALADSDQTRMCIIVYGLINVEPDHAAYVNVKGGANLRALPDVNSIRLELIPQNAPVYVLKDAPVTDSQKNIWRRVEVGDMLVGWMRSDLLTEGQQPPMSITAPELWADILTADPATTVTFAVAGKSFTVKVADITRTVNVAADSYLNVRADASTKAAIVGRLNRGDRIVVPSPDKPTNGFARTVAPVAGWVSVQYLK